MHNKDGEQSTTKVDHGQAGQKDLKAVPWNQISTSNEEGTSIKIVISNVRLYDESGRSGKHAMWSLQDMKKGLHGWSTLVFGRGFVKASTGRG